MPRVSPARRTQSHAHAWRGPALVAAAVLVAVLATLDGPGVTCDEYYDVGAGKRLVQAWKAQGLGFFRTDNIERNFGPLSLHPPLGRWLLGWTHDLFDQVPQRPEAVSLYSARVAPAIAFALLVFLVGWSTARASGNVAGVAAAASLAVVPRAFAHAHFATLDTLTSLFFVAALLALIEAQQRGTTWWHFALAGIVWGLAMATKLHGLLFAAPALVWLAGHLRRRAVLPACAWLVSGAATFFAAWPWLWPAPVERFKEFLSTATERHVLHVFYQGQVWDDRAVPWHYPWTMFVVTLPLGILALGLVGLYASRRQLLIDPRRSLIVGTLLFLLLLFSLPAAPVYDGVRLFLMVFPLWAMLAGEGLAALLAGSRVERFGPRTRYVAAAMFLALQGVGIAAYHPFQLSHYNLLVGGLPGAERLGFETTYWGDTINGELLRAARLDAGRPVLFAPHLASYQAPAVEFTLPELFDQQATLVGWDPHEPEAASDCRDVLVYRRRAELDEVWPIVEGAEIVSETSRQGVWLARWYRLPRPLGELDELSKTGAQ